METGKYSSRELIGRFLPYFKKYRGTLVLDLLCAALTTVCELVLPMIMRYITNEGIRDLTALVPCIGTHQAFYPLRIFFHIIRPDHNGLNHCIKIICCLV